MDHDFDILKSIDQVFCKIFLNLGLSDTVFFSWSWQRYSLGVEYHRDEVFFLSLHITGTCYQNDLSLIMSPNCFKIVFAWFSTFKMLRVSLLSLLDSLEASVQE